MSGGGRVILPTGIARADVVVDGEKIRTVASDAIDVGFDREIEAEGCYLLPGGVDPHVHTNLELVFCYSDKPARANSASEATGGLG